MDQIKYNVYAARMGLDLKGNDIGSHRTLNCILVSLDLIHFYLLKNLNMK